MRKISSRLLMLLIVAGTSCSTGAAQTQPTSTVLTVPKTEAMTSTTSSNVTTTATPATLITTTTAATTTVATWAPLGWQSRVLLIGDSISIGYTAAVQEGLGHPAPLVVHHQGNAQSTDFALKSNRLQTWLGDGDWDVIHFNFGLHDLGWADAAGNEVAVGTPKAGPRVSLDEYRQNLQRIVDILAQTEARLIWASTTPVFETSGSREAGAESAYNEVARLVMIENGIAVVDLNPIALSIQELRVGGSDNVHFTSAGYQVLSSSVVDAIRAR